LAERRTKEIGIRKTNGARTRHILSLLTVDFTRWVLLANLIAWPLSLFAMRRWLEGFANRTDISLWIFGMAGVIAFLVALGTVSFHAIRASMLNPGISPRYEEGSLPVNTSLRYLPVSVNYLSASITRCTSSTVTSEASLPKDCLT
jgi:hypothetical protein